MASYLEVKKVLKDILILNTDIDETCDIIMPDSYIQLEERNIVFSNADLKNAYNNMQIFNKEKLEIYSSTYREVALQLLEPSMMRRMMYLETISDSINGLEYSLGPASSGVRKINRVNAIIAKFLTILKLQPNRATLRSDLTQAVR